MAPLKPLPISDEFEDVEDYVESLLQFTSSSVLFQTICGGVHILDSFIQEPSLYDTILPKDWRSWLADCGTMELLDVLVRDDLDVLQAGAGEKQQLPPSFAQYIRDIRKHSLIRSFSSRPLRQKTLARNVAVGMVPKKIHEVTNFADYVVGIAEGLEKSSGQPITHFVDFGSGQNYLGRALASPPYQKHIIAVESKELNISGAKGMDVHANLAEREKVMRNKKLYREKLYGMTMTGTIRNEAFQGAQPVESGFIKHAPDLRATGQLATIYNPGQIEGSIQYVKHVITNGDLSNVIEQIAPVSKKSQPLIPASRTSQVQSNARITKEDVDGLARKDREGDQVDYSGSPRLMAISVHSCGNLSHHGIRSLLLNPSVQAIAIVGCCYNLLTERLGPPTNKEALLQPSLPRRNDRVARASAAFDPDGFPMSTRIANYKGKGVHFNITARMMAVQAPQNWSEKESDSFFTRHFFRALLQRVFFDRGIVSQSFAASPGNCNEALSDQGTDPVIIGSLRKGCYSSFSAYVRGAMTKLALDPERGTHFAQKMESMTDEEIEGYAEKYSRRKKELSDMWSLMSFSAGVVESVITVDRWQYLREHSDMVTNCWVEAVFDHKQSPRNMVVVGIKQ